MTPTIHLQRLAAKIISNSVAISTREKYTACFKRFIRFAKIYKLQILPLHQDTVVLFATFVSTYSSWKNVNIHLAAIKFFAQVNGYDVSKISTSPKLKRLLKGIESRETSLPAPRDYPPPPYNNASGSPHKLISFNPGPGLGITLPPFTTMPL